MPTSLDAILIALLVLSPEGVSAYNAAARNQLQRAVSLSLGSALSTLGMTVPVMLAISVVTGTSLDLGLGHVEIVLLALTLFVCQMTFRCADQHFARYRSPGVVPGLSHACVVSINAPPTGGFRLWLKAGSIGHSAD